MRILLLLPLIAALVGAVPAPPTKEFVTGLWLGEDRTQGGMANWIEFRPDGTAELSFGALVGALMGDTYGLEGSALTLHVFSGKATAAGAPIFESVRKTVRIDGDHAVVESQSRDEQPLPEAHSPEEQAMLKRLREPVTMARVGPATPGAFPIAGTWSYPHYTGPTAYETFTPAGKWYLRVPMQHRQGRYIVTSTAVTVQWAGQPSDTFSRNGDVLMLGAADGKHSTYRRAPD